MSFNLILSICVVVVTWFISRLLRIGTRGSNLPPGPPTIPVLGNAHLFPTKQVHLQFTGWWKQYGDIYSLKVGNQTMVVLNTPQLVQQLLDQRTVTTSDRPTLYIIDVITGGLNVPLMRYGQLWKDYRRALRDLLSHEACQNHQRVQHAEATQLSYDLYKAPQDFFTHVRRYSSSTILSVAFGLRCPRYADSIISRFFTVQRDQDRIAGPGGAPPLDMFPILKYVPERWANWKTTARNIRREHRALWHDLVDIVEKRIREGKRQGCFMEDVWDRQEQYSFDREKTAYLGSALMEAGSDTTAVFLQSFISFMAAFPDVQKRAQKELDDVVGTARSPVFDDWESLPYIQAIIKEIHRYRPTTPQLVPHNTTAEERINDYILPKGTTIFVNLWGIYHDPRFFDEPETFNPDRFLRSQFGTRPSADDTGRRHDMLFGSGRRICPGMELANNSIKINTMNMLWAFDFNLAKDDAGKRIPIDLNDTTDGILMTQKPFKCNIEPRSIKHARIIRDNYAATRDTFAQFEQDLTDDERKFVAEW